MLAFQVQNGQLREVAKPLPKLRRGWALIRVRLAGICNTDVEILRGYHGFGGTPGHEFVGEVAQVAGVSTAAKKSWLGKRVCGEINVSCSAYGYKPLCNFCRRGLKTHCTRRTVLGIVAHDGAFAEYLALPLENLHVLPRNVPDEQAVFLEPLAAACEILDQLDIRKYREAAVLGDGKLAQLVARVLHTVLRGGRFTPSRSSSKAGRTRSSLSCVTLYGKHSGKLALARQVGIQTVQVTGNKSDLAKIKARYQIVVDATGSPTGLALAQHLTEPRGTIVLKSTFHGAAPVETWPIVVNELNVIGSRCGPFAKAIALLRSGKVDPTPLIARTFPLSEAPEAMHFAQKPEVMKVLLKP